LGDSHGKKKWGEPNTERVSPKKKGVADHTIMGRDRLTRGGKVGKGAGRAKPWVTRGGGEGKLWKRGAKLGGG